MKMFKKIFEDILLEKKKRKSKNKWNPKKYYKNSTYGFYPYAGIGHGHDVGGDIAGVGGEGGGDGG